MKKMDTNSSTSGGMAFAFMTSIVNKGGFVYGVKFDDELNLVYHEANTIEKIREFKGSKYVQANTGNIFRKCEERLKQGKLCLFIGLPCQVAGFKSYLKRDYEKLYTIDLLCHGVPSQKFNKQHIDYLKKRENLQYVTNVKYRTFDSYSLDLKSRGKTVYISDEYEDEYVIGFVSGLTFHQCCYSCIYAECARVGDITLGDFWGLGKHGVPYKQFTDNGVNLLLINTVKGSELLTLTQKNCYFEKREFSEALYENETLTHSSNCNVGRNTFVSCYMKGNGFENAVKTAMPEEFKQSAIASKKIIRKRKKVSNTIKKLIGINLTLWIQNMKGR